WLRRSFVFAVTSVAALCAVGCGPKAVRGEEVAGLDDQAMSTGLDRRDLQKMLHENMQALQASPVIARWQKETPTVSVLPLRNETTEHIDSQLDSLISDIETTLVNAGHVQVISLESQPALMEQVRKQYQDGFDQSKIAGWGKQIGVRYVVTGKVFAADERQDSERRVQYFMFIQVLDVETSAILFQFKTSVTKALI
ncbi:MAG TPA: penicillin-binding protein activator LpoB, partial [Polyangiaceae bacterium]|nr:penicillin-binding protein activator LpoB [Polyangiaceae bacterium]